MIDAISFLNKEPYLAELDYAMGLLNHLVQSLAASSSNLIFQASHDKYNAEFQM